MDRTNRFLLASVILAVALACAPILPQVAPLPTSHPGAVATMVAGTRAVAAAQTQEMASPTFTATVTRPPTNTPTITPTATATIIFKLPTVTATKKVTATPKGGGGSGGGGSGGGGGGGGGGGNTATYKCSVLSTTVKVNNVIVPGSKPSVPANTFFTVTWKVLNKSSIGWDHNSVDFRYKYGTPFQQQSLYDFPNTPAVVAVGQSVELVVDNPPMLSPATSGDYKAHWGLKTGSTSFCDMVVSITVP